MSFLHFKVETQNRPFLTILACCSLCKLTNFASFQNRVILKLWIFNIFWAIFPIENLLLVVRFTFLYDFHSLKFIPKVGHFWRFRLAIVFAKWPFFLHLKWCHFLNTKCISKLFSHKTSLLYVKSHFLYDFYSLCKMGNFTTLQNCVFLSRFSIEHLFSFWRVFSILSFVEYQLFLESRLH